MYGTADRVEETYSVFYRVERAGAFRLSDGGGPFGFDVAVALLIDDLVTQYACDALCETGSFVGDTTVYLARRYPHLPVYSCDIDESYAAVARHRVAGNQNAIVVCQQSPDLVADVVKRYERPLLFLDAHWGDPWPLPAELATITASRGAIAVIHDFDIGHPRFSYDTYQGLTCGPGLLDQLPHPPCRLFVLDPDSDHPLPCLQVGRRAGVAIVAIGMDTGPLETHPNLITRMVVADAVIDETVTTEHGPPRGG
jgi:hypothetical protein